MSVPRIMQSWESPSPDSGGIIALLESRANVVPRGPGDGNKHNVAQWLPYHGGMEFDK